MIITCDKCKARYNLKKKEMIKSVMRVRCSGCGFIFNAYNTRSERIKNGTELPEDGCKVITVCNQKGGVAKTSTCLNLGFSLTGMKKKVLLIDFDVQANLTVLLGYSHTHSFYDIIKKDAGDLTDFIMQTRYRNLFLLPASNNLVLLSKKFFGKKDFEYMLKSKFKGLKEQFDYIIIDTPPSVEFYTLNALTASDLAVIPGQCDYLSTHGIDQISRIIDLVRKKSNPDLISRILITMFDSGSTASELIFTKLIQLYKDRVLKTVIRQDEKIRESQIMSRPVLHYDKDSDAGSRYLHLAKELSEIPFI